MCTSLRFRACLTAMSLAAVPAAFPSGPIDPLVIEARGIVQHFATDLQSALLRAMADGGPGHAIAVCNTEAPAIAGKLSAEGWQVRRTSLKFRNPENAPDEFERGAMLEFEERLREGAAMENLEIHVSGDDAGGYRFRYLKAIGTGPLCLACHGSDVAPEILERLEQLYPEDQARGYRAGDLRGAFSLHKTEF